MYFKPRDNRFYSFIVSLKPLYRYIMTIGIVCVVILFWLLVVYFPLNTRIGRCSSYCTQMQGCCQTGLCAQKQCPLLQQEISALQTELDVMNNNAQSNASTCVTALLEQAHKHNVVITSCSIHDQKKNKENNKAVISLHGQGSIKNIIALCTMFAQLPSPLSCEQYTVSYKEQDLYTFSFILNTI